MLATTLSRNTPTKGTDSKTDVAVISASTMIWGGPRFSPNWAGSEPDLDKVKARLHGESVSIRVSGRGTWQPFGKLEEDGARSYMLACPIHSQ